MTSRTDAPLLSVSVDVEDWYMGIEQPYDQWDRFERRLHHGLDRVLDLLDAARTRATFFILGAVAERHPDAIRAIAARGHEVGSHGWSHTKVYDLTLDAFRDEVRRTDQILLDLTGQKPIGFRAPYFSITRASRGALDVLADEGYRYDSSIYPGSNWRYGIPDANPDVHRLDSGLVEFPVSTFQVGKKRLGLGGAYLRILPLAVTDWAVRRRLDRGEPTTVYVHPWEFDPDHPWVRFRPRAMATHYFALRTTTPKLSSIVARFSTAPMRDVLTQRGWLAA